MPHREKDCARSFYCKKNKRVVVVFFQWKNHGTTCTSAHTFNAPVRFQASHLRGLFTTLKERGGGGVNREVASRWHQENDESLARSWARAGKLAQTIISDIYASLDRCGISYRAKQAAPFFCQVQFHFMKWSHSLSCRIWEYRFCRGVSARGKCGSTRCRRAEEVISK